MLKFNQPYINQDTFRKKIRNFWHHLIVRTLFFVLLTWFFVSYISHVFDFKIVRHANIQISSFLLKTAFYPAEVYENIKESYLFYRHVLAENAELKKKNTDLMIKNQALLSELDANIHLKKLISNETFYPKVRMVVRILGTVQHFSKSMIYITANESIKQDMKNAIIFDQDGLIGRIIERSTNKAVAMLLTDYQSKIPVRCKRNGVQAIVSGNGSGILDVELIESTLDQSESNLIEGDILATSGLDDIFPPDIPVAKISSMQDTDITAIPCCNINHAQYAFLTMQQ